MRLHRFYIAQPLGEEVVIDNVSLIKQWLKVFRYTTGNFVVLFNGDGRDVTYSLQSIDSKKCILTYTSDSPVYIPRRKITLYLSLIKKDNFELVAQKVTELGITDIVPIISERSEKKEINEERLQKIIIEASEQCGRGDIPKLSPLTKLSDALEHISSTEKCLLMNMNGVRLSTTNTQEELEERGVAFFIGPEGGWSAGEESLFEKRGIISISLGNTVLRAETAAIATAVILTC